VIEDRYYISDSEYKEATLVQTMHAHGRIARENPCEQNQYISAVLDNTDTYHGDHLISNSAVVPMGTTTFKAEDGILLDQDFTVQTGKIFEAYIDPCPNSDWQYEYALADHLGNTRVVFADVDGNGTVDNDEILQEINYFPFGKTQSGPWNERLKNDYQYGYNNKELIQDWGLGWGRYGARFYDPTIGRFTSIDPNAEKYAYINPYNYVYNNPVNGIDPDGRDGILLVFPDYKIQVGNRKVPHLGHAGVLLIDNKTGTTKYYEYGRYDSEGRGLVRKVTISDVEIGPNGKPTNKSLNKVLGQISKRSGKGGRIEGAYIESDDFESMHDYAKELMGQNSDPDREPYSIWNNNCGTFGCDVLNQDSDVAGKAPGIIDPRPNSIIGEYQDVYDSVSYDPETGTTKYTVNKKYWQGILDMFKNKDNKNE